METQYTINEWQTATFGNPNWRAALERFREEFRELEEALVKHNGEHVSVSEEIADVFITLAGLAKALNCDIQQSVNSKMRVNRSRTWVSRGDGTGQHVSELHPTENAPDTDFSSPG